MNEKPKGLYDDRTAKAALIARKKARDKILRYKEDEQLRKRYEL